jgi:hypothetical protein
MTNTATLPETSSTAPATTDQPIFSILALVFGITGIFTGTVFPLSIAAIVLGILALKRERKARTMATWGIVTGALPFAFGVLALGVLVPLGLLGAFSGFDFSTLG